MSSLSGYRTVVPSNSEQVHCNSCRKKTSHKVLKSVVEKHSECYGDDEGGDLHWQTTFEMLQCGGCREVVLRRSETHPIDDDVAVDYFPPATSRHPPAWCEHSILPAECMWLFREIYRSLDAGNYCLPMMGARALLDVVIVDKIGDVGTFQEKLKKLQDDGCVSPSQLKFLEVALDAGNAAVHRGHIPSTKNIHRVMNIVENLIQALYVLEHEAQGVRKATPPRPPKKKIQNSSPG